MGNEVFYATHDMDIEGVKVKRGDVLGRRHTSGDITPAKEGITRGHIEARMNRTIAYGDPKKLPAEPSKSGDEKSKGDEPPGAAKAEK